MRVKAGPATGRSQPRATCPASRGFCPGVAGTPATRTGTQQRALRGERRGGSAGAPDVLTGVGCTGVAPGVRGGQRCLGRVRSLERERARTRMKASAEPARPTPAVPTRGLSRRGSSDFQFLCFLCWEAGLGGFVLWAGSKKGEEVSSLRSSSQTPPARPEPCSGRTVGPVGSQAPLGNA